MITTYYMEVCVMAGIEVATGELLGEKYQKYKYKCDSCLHKFRSANGNILEVDCSSCGDDYNWGFGGVVRNESIIS